MLPHDNFNLWATESLGMSGDVPVAGDYDGDGQPDLCVWQPSNGTWYVIPSSIGPGGGFSQPWGLPGDIPVVGDFDGDGKSDCAIWRPSTGVWWVIPSGVGSYYSYPWGLPGDVPVTGDYDGDGKTDLAIWRPSTGTFWVLFSSGIPYASQVLGEPGDVPVPGDYDGDGITDFAVWRPSNGTWYIIPSSQGVAGSYSRQWGLPGDIPTPGHYAADGETDLAIWRPSTGTWWVLPSNGAAYYGQQWGLPGDIPVFPSPIGTGAPFVKTKNLTHPTLSPNFEVGDTFQTTVSGPPNQPVYRSQAWNGSASTTQLGQTDATGHFQFTGAEVTGPVGTYGEVWSVGSAQASPTLIYTVAQAGGVGWVATGESAQTPDGYVTGYSYLSISNNTAIYSYSTTYLNYAASAYYDSQTVATLFQDGQPIQQAVATGSSSASGSLSATATPWYDYTLQTDSYVVAFLVIGSDFYNPLYLGDGSCDDASSDCTIGLGGGLIEVVAASIYVGSTLADQTAVPNPASFLAPGQLPSGVANTTDMLTQLGVMALVAAKAINETYDLGKSSDPPVPSFLELVGPSLGDTYQGGYPLFANGVARERYYIVKDSLGRTWNPSYPLLINERFVQVSLLGSLPAANGTWTSNASSFTFPDAQIINKSDSTMFDLYGFTSSLFSVKYNQYYYASNFQTPSWWNFSPAQTTHWPLVIVDAYNTCAHGSNSSTQFPVGVPIPLPGQTIYLTSTGIGVDGDSGPPVGYKGNPAHSGCGSPTFP